MRFRWVAEIDERADPWRDRPFQERGRRRQRGSSVSNVASGRQAKRTGA
ncbi:hypothetical protein SAMN05880568_2892 [Microbacterium sp. RURRCA19A]|nr:hypothetical protein SAMN05880568_2892 [Microbacterium sp. RURRCA19A]